ncbi:unnamed protein product [Staurois parvus]|uniref:Uncharacterized protein n=1 Tax=Staurois parvus TaxID=386267 RepID=A0ABN9B7E3_9NEOB|nr:unnamed protein product [Staurois parvus]
MGAGQGTEGTVATNVETTAGSKAAEGNRGIGVSADRADRAHKSGNSDGTEVTVVGASTHPESSSDLHSM